MIRAIRKVTHSSVTVRDADGEDCTITIELTPVKLYLTQATKRAILATGFLLRYGEEMATDKDVINGVLEAIRREVLRLCDRSNK